MASFGERTKWKVKKYIYTIEQLTATQAINYKEKRYYCTILSVFKKNLIQAQMNINTYNKYNWNVQTESNSIDWKNKCSGLKVGDKVIIEVEPYNKHKNKYSGPFEVLAIDGHNIIVSINN